MSLSPGPFLVRARVARTKREDGSLQLRDTVKQGEFVVIDLYSKTHQAYALHGVPVLIEIVQSAEDGGWFPWEFLEVVL